MHVVHVFDSGALCNQPKKKKKTTNDMFLNSNKGQLQPRCELRHASHHRYAAQFHLP